MSVPQYVSRYFRGTPTDAQIKRRYAQLQGTLGGMYTNEYKDLEKYMPQIWKRD